ncbi:endoplasmic reticulum aminopeptidase 2-like [Macrobrachium nipponense]|uniref:endoplasmic reticulum aminopeptidase 2-like n=1 Tax=Macrobrachium nipponense TaxID=159736 RepID=UPI0030C8B75A
MPVKVEKKDTPSPDLTEVTFKKSVPMVTYLVCFIVCDFTYKEVLMKSGMPFRVYAPEGRVKYTQFALETGVSILQMYEEMFDLPFPLPKSDMAAIPDYSSGATEHWGIITYRETNTIFFQ